ncbi:MAG TPA: hypothetical protein VF168_05300 [Trueperaceae bacterium]
MTEKSTRFLDRGRHLWLGLALIAVMWPLNWFLPGLRTMFLFFPLWLGYILTVDGLVLRRRGSSLLSRAGPSEAVMLFLISAVSWWLFEAVNLVLHNWRYLGRELIGDAAYALFASVAFSVVMPAVFASAELVRDSAWIERFGSGPRLRPTRRNLLLLIAIGFVMLALSLGFPDLFFPLIWGAIYLILDPLNHLLGKASLLDRLERGDWRPVASLAAGALMTGFFWELWNYFSYPKWVYDIPGVGFLHIFEMPLLGYLGYLPFGLELFALFALLRWRPLDPQL